MTPAAPSPSSDARNTPPSRKEYKDLLKAERVEQKNKREKEKSYNQAKKQLKAQRGERKKAKAALQDQATKKIIQDYGRLGLDVFFDLWIDAYMELTRVGLIKEEWEATRKRTLTKIDESNEGLAFHLKKTKKHLAKEMARKLKAEVALTKKAQLLFMKHQIEMRKDISLEDNPYYLSIVQSLPNDAKRNIAACLADTVRRAKANHIIKCEEFERYIETDTITAAQEILKENDIPPHLQIRKQQAVCLFGAARRALCAPVAGAIVAVTSPFVFSMKFLSLMNSVESAFKTVEAKETPFDKLRRGVLYKIAGAAHTPS